MASELQSYRATGPFYFFLQKKVTELQSYRATGHISRESWLQSYRATGLRDTFIFFFKKKSYRATELQGYRPPLPGVMASELQSYRATGHFKFFAGKKDTSPRNRCFRATEL